MSISENKHKHHSGEERRGEGATTNTNTCWRCAVCVCDFVRFASLASFVGLFVRSFARSFVRSFVCAFDCLFVCTFVRSCVCAFVCTFVRLFVHRQLVVTLPPSTSPPSRFALALHAPSLTLSPTHTQALSRSLCDSHTSVSLFRLSADDRTV